MKATGIVRKLDSLGRIVLPVELRRMLNIEEKDALEIYVDGEDVILRKYQPGCALCDSVETIGAVGGKSICGACAKKMQEVLREND